MNSLAELVYKIDSLVTSCRPLSEIKPLLVHLHDQIEALERDHAALKTTHAELAQAHSKLNAEHTETKDALAKAQGRDDSHGFGGLGIPL
jgi:peptidoglycan hydrolase CwlO-like protein